MKLPFRLTKFFSQKPIEREYLLSLILAVDYVAAGAWWLDDAGKLHLAATGLELVSQDSWDVRIEAIDRAIAAVEDRTAVPRAIKKVVLGLPSLYLTEVGEISSDVRRQVKKLSEVMELAPIGFVAVDTAIAYHLKREEGIPANVILIGVSGGKLAISLFRVGQRVGAKIVEREEVAHGIEAALKSFDGDDVLPSRMLIYGGAKEDLEAVKTELLKHPWPTRVNFLHFPKIELLPSELPILSVCEAGASELTAEVKEEEEEETMIKSQPSVTKQEIREEEKVEEKPEITEGEVVEKIVKEGEEAVAEAGEDVNVRLVAPEELGFKKKDVIEAGLKLKAQKEEEGKEEGQLVKVAWGDMFKKIRLPKVRLPTLRIPSFGYLKGNTRFVLPLIVGILGLVLLWWLYSFFIPRATITVLVIPKTIEEEAAVTADPKATIVDSANKILPGLLQEKEVSGEKTTAVTGKKEVGDPARGTVTIYNKSLNSRTFVKGSVLAARGLPFTLDNEVQVASATESIGSITFGKANGAVTASEIGPEANLPSGTEFTFKDVSSSVAIARNEQALTGGTSREVTVVSRADYDNLVKILSEELLARAREELAGGLGGLKLIEETVKTMVADKVFDQELDEETKELHGKVRLVISGLAYSEDDIKKLMTDLVTAEVPAGYSLSSGRTQVTIAKTQVKKDGSVALSAKLHSTILPQLNPEDLKGKLSGKKLAQAIGELKGQSGIAGAEVRFRWSLGKNRLPINKNNISVSIAIQE